TGRIKTINAQVKIIVIVKNTDFSRLRGRLAGGGNLLYEILGRLGQLPLGLIQLPIDHDRTLDLHSFDFELFVVVGIIDVLAKCTGGRHYCQEQPVKSCHVSRSPVGRLPSAREAPSVLKEIISMTYSTVPDPQIVEFLILSGRFLDANMVTGQGSLLRTLQASG